MYEYEYSDPGAFGALGVGYIIFMLLIAVFIIACYWKIFEKAGHPGWAAIVPIYNMYILLMIIGKPGWWLILMFIPCVNIIIMIMIYLDLARVFGKSTGFGIGLILLGIVFIPILAFGDAEYQG
jgi:hypothetical protein